MTHISVGQSSTRKSVSETGDMLITIAETSLCVSSGRPRQSYVSADADVLVSEKVRWELVQNRFDLLGLKLPRAEAD